MFTYESLLFIRPPTDAVYAANSFGRMHETNGTFSQNRKLFDLDARAFIRDKYSFKLQRYGQAGQKY